MSKHYSCPGKVFLLGEYAVLAGGAGILCAVAPRFEMQSSRDLSHHQSVTFPSGSPADRLLQEMPAAKDFQSHWNFTDPHEGRGGFGASTAQYLLSAAALELDMDTRSLWERYRRHATAPGAMPPSGADLICQSLGGFVFFDAAHVEQSRPLPQQKLAGRPKGMAEHLFLFSATEQPGRKTATHRHLEDLKAQGFPQRFSPLLQQLNQWVKEGAEAIAQGKHQKIAQIFNDYGNALQAAGWEAEATTEDKAALKKLPGVLGLKGTGAMQSDALLVWVENPQSDDSRRLVEVAEKRNLKCIARGLQLAEGWKCHD